MFTVLIIDDEHKTREGLKKHIPWDSLGFTTRLSAENGKQALKILNSQKVHAVLTDIVMPEMDGIELAAVIQRDFPQIKIVFISGHQDIEYLKSAFEFAAVDYVFKPIDKNEIISLFRRIRNILEKETRQKEYLQSLSKKLEQQLPLLQDRFIEQLLEGKLYHQESILSQLEGIGLSCLKNNPYTVVSFEINYKEKTDVKDMGLLEIQGKEIISSSVSSGIAFYVLSLHYNRFAVVLSGIAKKTEKEECIQKIFSGLSACSSTVVTAGVGGQVQSIEDAALSYEQSLRALEKQFFFGTGQIIHYSDISGRTVRILTAAIREELLRYIRIGNEKELSVLLRKIESSLKQSGVEDIETVKLFAFELAIQREFILREQNISNPRRINSEEVWIDLQSSLSADDIFTLLNHRLTSAAKLIHKAQEDRTSRIVREMRDFIRNNISSDISAQMLADRFQISTNYVSMLFKKELEITFSEYVTGVKIQKAKELLNDPRLRIFEIADMSGYRDAEYFTKVFKKYTGRTPSEYREES